MLLLGPIIRVCQGSSTRSRYTQLYTLLPHGATINAGQHQSMSMVLGPGQSALPIFWYSAEAEGSSLQCETKAAPWQMRTHLGSFPRLRAGGHSTKGHRVS